MKSGYKVVWSDHASLELQNTIEYIEFNWTQRELNRLFQELEHTINLISDNPFLFQISMEPRVRKAIVLKVNSLYYRLEGDTVTILSFFSNRQNPKKVKY